MSERTQRKSPPPLVVDIASGDEADNSADTTNSQRLRHQDVIEINSDVSEDEDVEIISVTEPSRQGFGRGGNDVQITGQHPSNFSVFDIEFPGGPPVYRPMPRAVPSPRVVPPPRFAPSSRALPSSRAFPSSRALPPFNHFSRHRPSPEISSRNVRRRPNPQSNQNFYRTSFFDDMYTSPTVSFEDIPGILAQHQRRILQLFQGRDGDIPSTIMERINREEESTLDRKIESENKHNKKVLDQKKGIAGGELKGYTNNISAESNMVCELCGITLGEGIPKDFIPNPEYDEDFEQHVQESHVPAPWYCIRQCFTTDIDFSKRVFSAKCGHVFCGRCMKNIANRQPARGGVKTKKLTILNPQISAPRKCPATECGKAFSKRNFFTELYL